MKIETSLPNKADGNTCGEVPRVDIVSALIRHQTLFADHLRCESEAILNEDGPSHSGCYSHETFKYGALSLATLYKLNHPENCLQGKVWLRDLSLKLIAPHLKQLKKPAVDLNNYIQTVAEWPPYIIARVVTLLGDEAGDKVRADARTLITAWANYAIAEPFGRTAPNHEAWRCLSLYRCGEVFGEGSWQERSLFFLRQLFTLQTREGFGEEGRHHGPSMKYNALMLSP